MEETRDSFGCVWEGVAVLCRSADGSSLLMVLQGHPNESPSWAVPGGSIDLGETPQEAAVRETKEETGLDVQILRPYSVVEGVKTHGAYRVHFFEAEVVGGEMQARDPDDLIHRVEWIPTEKLHDLQLSHEDQREMLTSF